MSLNLVQKDKTSIYGLGAFNEFYLVQDKRDTDRDFTAEQLKTPGLVMPYEFDVLSLRTNPDFQNRNEKFSEISVQRIIHAVENGSFNWAAFDPVVIWLNPSDNKYYILSGHSRCEAFWRLLKMGKKVDGRSFAKIPARVFKGSYEEAKYFAQNSNTLSTKETTTERASYYHKLLTLTNGNKKEIAKIKDECKSAEGKEFKTVWALAHLNPSGAAFELLTDLEKGETAATVNGLGDVENKNTALILAVWVGNLRAAFPQLTNEHENEIFYFLIRGGYPGKYKTYTELKDIISALVAARTDSDGNFNASKKINIERSSEELTHEKQYQFELSELDKEIKKSESKYTKFLQEIIKRHESDQKFSIDDYLKELKQFLADVIYDRRKKIQFEKKHGLYTQADKDQQNLFSFDGLAALPDSMRKEIAVGLRGLAAMRDPKIFNPSESELKCNGMRPTYKRLADYSHLVETPLNITDFNGFGLKDTLPVLLSSVRESVPQVHKLAKHLQAETPLQSMFNVWHWLHTNIKYNYDEKNKEQVRTAARSFAERERGVDCDCLSVFTAALLQNMGLNPKFEIVAFNGNPEFGHIYTTCNDIVIDRVMGTFNKRPGFITKTKIMEIPVYNLRGCKSSIEGLRGLQADLLSKIESGKATKRDKVDFKKARVLVSLEGDPVAYRAASMLMPYVVDVDEHDGGFYFDNPEIAGLAVKMDEELQRAEMAGLSGPELEGVFKKFGGALKKAATSTVKAVANTTKAVVKATGQAVSNTVKATTNVVKATANVVKAGAQAVTGNTTAAKETMQKAGQQVATAAKATVQSVTKPTTTVVKSAVETTKDVVKNTIVEPTKAVVQATGQLIKVIFVKINPVTVVMRNALRALIAINFLGLATRLNVANYNTQANAEAAGYTAADYYQSMAAKSRVVNFVVKMGGSKDKIEKAIINGAKRKALFKGDYNKTQVINDDGSLSGLGEPLTIGSCLAAVGAFFAKIWNWVKNIAVKFFSSDAGKALVKAGAEKLADKVGGGSESNTEVNSEETPLAPNDANNSNVGGMSKTVKFGLFALVIAGIAIAASDNKKKKQKK